MASWSGLGWWRNVFLLSFLAIAVSSACTKAPRDFEGGQAGGAGGDGALGAGGAENAAGDGNGPDVACPDTLCGGICSDTATDVENCGKCGNSCTALPHLGSTDGVACAAGVCVVPATACAPGYAHCSADPNDGCETDITVPERCGACDVACEADAPFCALGACVTTCPAAAPTACGNVCADLKSDPKRCGDCATACAQPLGGGSASCTAGACGTECLASFHECPGTTDCFSDADATHCGPDCLACEANSNVYKIRPKE